MAMGIVFTGAASLVAAALCAWAAARVAARSYSTMSRAAGLAFATWWVLVAAILANDGTRVLLGVSGDPPVGTYVALSMLKVVTMGTALTALGAYVLYLWTGHMRHVAYIGVAAAAHAGWMLARLVARLPADVVVSQWSTRLVLTPGEGLVPAWLQALLFFGPGIVLAFAYGALWRRVRTSALRMRLLSVLSALLILFVVGSIQFNPATPGDSPLFPVFALLTVLAGVAAVAGTRPGNGRPVEAPRPSDAA